MEGGTLSSHSVPHLMSRDLTPDNLAPTVVLSSAGLLNSTTDAHIDWLNSNSDTSSQLPYFSTQRKTSKTRPHFKTLSNHLLASNERHKSNLNPDKLLAHPQLESDPLSTQDWGEGEVGESVDSIVQALMKKTVNTVGERGRRKEREGNKRRHHDPRVTMEMRHKQV